MILHNFLQKKNVAFWSVEKKLSDDSKVRHIGGNYFLEGEDCSTIYKAKNLRTLWASRSINLTMVFNELKFLRVLDLRGIDFEQLPDEIERLLHLRYLDLSGSSRLLELPKIMSRLYNLQTLKLNWCQNLIKLPDGIVKLINLRHLEVERTDKLGCIPRGIGRLKFLRTLCKFFVGDASNGCDISELKDLCFLQGILVIKGLGRVADAKKATQAELKKKRLDVLSLYFDNSEEGDFDNMSGVLENLQPHEDVQELNIGWFACFQFPSWIPNSSMSINLVRLWLEGCKRTTKLPALVNLASLEELNIIALISVKYIGTQFCGFGVVAFLKLKKLVISRMLELIEWELPVSTNIMPCLQQLKLSDCPMLSALPSLGRLEFLESLEISELPSIIRVGPEFFRISGDEFCGFGVVAFPKLKKNLISRMLELNEWELLVSTHARIIMPCLQELEFSYCPMLRALIQEQEEEKTSCSRQPVIPFPKLTHLFVCDMEEWEEWIMPQFLEDAQIITKY